MNQSWPDGGDGNWAVAREAELARLPRRLLLWMAGPPQGALQIAHIDFSNGAPTAAWSWDRAWPYRMSCASRPKR